jgi:hypothetical protein
MNVSMVAPDKKAEVSKCTKRDINLILSILLMN